MQDSLRVIHTISSSTGPKTMNLQKFLASNAKLKSCDCEECEHLFEENLEELRVTWPAFDFQLQGVVFLARLTDSLGVAINHPRTDTWVARLVIDDQTILLQVEELSATDAFSELIVLLKEISPILSEKHQLFLTEHFTK